MHLREGYELHKSRITVLIYKPSGRIMKIEDAAVSNVEEESEERQREERKKA